MVLERDIPFLERCLELAEEAVAAGDQAFGSILVSESGEILAEDRNRIMELTRLAHPEYALAKWAAENLSVEERAKTTMYTTGEHCPMCAAAHGWVGLGTIVYLSSSVQLAAWFEEHNLPKAPVASIPVKEIVPKVEVRGPLAGALHKKLYTLHYKHFIGQNQ
jgi:tRNA(Arg) A34 adenosine deaminase TadA